MSRFSLRALGGVVALTGLMSGSANAQFPGNPGVGTPRPAFSPYLNLNRSGNSPAINYFGIVRPQFQALSTFQSLDQQSAANRQAISDAGTQATALPTTGHTVSFLNTSGYFMNLNPVQGGQGFGGQGQYSFGGSGFLQGGARPGGQAGGGRGAPRR